MGVWTVGKDVIGLVNPFNEGRGWGMILVEPSGKLDILKGIDR